MGKEAGTMKKIDLTVTLIFIAALGIIYFFWKCEYDPLVTLLAAIIIIAAGVMTHRQNKKLEELEEETQQQEQNSNQYR